MNLERFLENQLKNWETAQKNYEALGKILTKPFSAGSLHGHVQYNPARGVSTNAKTDQKTISKRPCFLCRHNRPEQQLSEEIIQGWELLINPFPIFPMHFTIACKEHTAQYFDIEIAKKFAEKIPGMVIFYNDDGAGASAPDHAHYQAVPKKSLPLINEIDSILQPNINEETNLEKYISNLPFKIILVGEDDESNIKNPYPINAFTWINSSGGISTVIIPRKQHRPEFYYLQPPQRRAISPGAVDMAGVLITPYEDDFLALTDEEINEIYKQVALSDD